MKINQQRDLYRDRLALLRSELLRFRGFLQRPKFQGYDARDGTPNNWISTDDVIRWLDQVFLLVAEGASDAEVQDFDAKALLGMYSEEFMQTMRDSRAQVEI